jgi:hypothetical protein
MEKISGTVTDQEGGRTRGIAQGGTSTCCCRSRVHGVYSRAELALTSQTKGKILTQPIERTNGFRARLAAKKPTCSSYQTGIFFLLHKQTSSWYLFACRTPTCYTGCSALRPETQKHHSRLTPYTPPPGSSSDLQAIDGRAGLASRIVPPSSSVWQKSLYLAV